MQERLKDIGEWLRVNGECIYGTRSWQPEKIEMPEQKLTIWFTKKGTNLYAICSMWPEGEIFIPVSDPSDNLDIEMIGVKQEVKWKLVEGGVLIMEPQISPAELPCRHAFVFKLIVG